MSNITSLSNAGFAQRRSDEPKSRAKRNRDDSNDETLTDLPCKKIILGTNEKDRSIAAVDPSSEISKQERRKSVVSNIGCSITADHLTKYVADELNIGMELIRVTPMNKNSQRFNSLQYRISVPESQFEFLMMPSTWPKGVRVREYVFKPRNGNGVSIDNFLVKRNVVQRQDPPNETLIHISDDDMQKDDVMDQID